MAEIESVTFIVNEKLIIDNKFGFKLDTNVNDFSKNICASSNRELFKTAFDNGFIGTLFDAYCRHYAISLSPDHVWCAIQQALSICINFGKNAELLRDKIVNHEGKMLLTHTEDGSFKSWVSNSDNLKRFVDQINQLIEKNTKNNLRESMETSFSTTSSETLFISRLLIMSTLQKYFGYKMQLMCGIPKVTLEGSLSDWKKLKEKSKILLQFGDSVPGKQLANWYEHLVLVLDEFINTYELILEQSSDRDSSRKLISNNIKNKINLDFWSKICHTTGGGSGPTYIKGWLNVFMPFTDNGRYILPNEVGTGSFGHIDTNDIPIGISDIPISIDDNGNEFNVKFKVGFFGATFVDENILRPSLDWLLTYDI